MDEGTRSDVIPDDVARRHEALLERVAYLERALEDIASSQTGTLVYLRELALAALDGEE
jgi:hypothetical protein